MQTPLKQTAATQLRPMTSFAIEALRLLVCTYELEISLSIDPDRVMYMLTAPTIIMKAPMVWRNRTCSPKPRYPASSSIRAMQESRDVFMDCTTPYCKLFC